MYDSKECFVNYSWLVFAIDKSWQLPLMIFFFKSNNVFIAVIALELLMLNNAVIMGIKSLLQSKQKIFMK
jgi:hypothetical protein